LQSSISNKKIDGILLDIHGAMSLEGCDDAEGYFVDVIRKLVGEDVMISLPMDLHGNISDQLFNTSNLITCYRTAPHIDVSETKQRAFKNMINYLKGDYNEIYMSKIDVPILLSGEKTSTEVEPGKSLYGRLIEVENHMSIIDVSIFMGFPWADQPRCHSSVIVSGTDLTIVEKETEKIATYYWSIRHKFEFVGPTGNLDDSIRIALRSKEKPFFISDTGDNPGAGGSGDLNIILRRFLEINQNSIDKKRILFASIFDKDVIEQIYEVNNTNSLNIELGGKTDTIYGLPVAMKVNIDYLFSDRVAGRGAVVSSGNISIIITENRYQYGTEKAFVNSGIDNFDDFDIIVVKMGYLEPDLKKAAKGWVMALTRGAVCQDMSNIYYQKLTRPIYPIDDIETSPLFCIQTKKYGRSE